jgi:hypothetical protein
MSSLMLRLQISTNEVVQTHDQALSNTHSSNAEGRKQIADQHALGKGKKKKLWRLKIEEERLHCLL